MKKGRLLKISLLIGSILSLSGCDFLTPVESVIGLSLEDPLLNSYLTSDIYDNHVGTDGLKVTAKLKDGETKTLSKSEFTYQMTNSDNVVVSPNVEFGNEGRYKVTVSYKDVSNCYQFTVIKHVPVTGISMSPKSKIIKLGESFTLNATVLPTGASNKDITWTASNDKVSVSDDGTVTTNSVGSSVVTAKTVDGNFTAQCNITVTNDGPDYQTITVEEALEIIDGLELNKVSSQEYYVRGIASNVDQDANGFNGAFLNSNLKFRSIKENGVASTANEIEGAEVIIFGYLENYNGIYQIPYLPSSASPTGQKYNGKLIWVDKEESQETIDVTNISVTPINKTLKINETYTLTANVFPINATDKTVNWTSTDSTVCSVSSAGFIKGLKVGETDIIAKTSNNLTAVCHVEVTDDSDTPITGNKFEIAFDKYGVDGQSELTTTTIRDQIIAGDANISSFTLTKRLYKGISGIKFGSNSGGGQMSFILSDTIKNLNCTKIIVDVHQYNTKSTTVSIYGDDSLLSSGSSSNSEIIANITNPKQFSSIKISTSSRAYVSKITLICEETEEIPVTAISIPSSKSISTGNSDTLDVSYTPSNANKGKSITWVSKNNSIATVSNGVVTGVSAGTAVIEATSEGGFKSSCTVTVSDVRVTGVSLSSSSETLSIGATKQLTANVAPSNATNKKVTWTSSNTNTATIDENGLVTAKAVGYSTITVKTNDGGKTATCSINVNEVTKDRWTILIYMCGADLESESGLASGDIKEILSVGSQPNDVNIVIETGGSKSWSLSSSYIEGATSISSSYLSRWHVKNKKIVLDNTYSYASMGASSTLQSFVEYGITEYPAEKTGVILWNHGGAMYGCCYDEKKDDDSLSNSEMKTAFSKALANTGESKLEFVGYDTCLTQVQDIAEFNSNYFNYMIASEEAEAGEGWDYDTWIDDVYNGNSTETILKAIVDGFIKDNGGASSTRSDQTLSYLDLSKMQAYKTAFESFASALKSQLSNKSINKSTFASWISKNVKAFCVDADEDEKYYCLFDVKDMINKIKDNSTYNPGSSYITSLETAFSNMVKYSVAQKGAGNAYGLGCIFVQSSTYSRYIKSAYTSTETNFSNWMSFLKSYSYLG